MFFVRILLIITLLVEAVVISWNVPWRARASTLGMNYLAARPDAPFFKPPDKPTLRDFQGRVSEFLDPKTVDVVVEVDRQKLFDRIALAIVIPFFVFGLLGLLVQKRATTLDVAFSLALSGGIVLGTVGVAIVNSYRDSALPPSRMPLFWAGGIALTCLLTVATRQRPTAQS